MRRDRSFLLAGFAALILLAPTSFGQSTRPGMEEIFSKELSAGHRLVVTREPIDIATLRGIPGSPWETATTAASIRVLMRAGGEPDLLLAAAVQADYPDFRKGFFVLDAFAGRGDIVLSCAVANLIGLWRIPLDVHQHIPTGWAFINPMWEYAAMYPIKKGEYSVSMSIDNDGQWSLLLSAPGRRADQMRYRQEPNAWQFQRIPKDPNAARSPATRPAR